jgi:hypothetical protein
MLVSLIETLNLVDELFVFLAVHTDSDCQPAHDENCVDVAVLGDGLEVGDIEAARRLLKDVSKVLGHQAIEPLESGKPDDPAVGGGPGRPEVARVTMYKVS